MKIEYTLEVRRRERALVFHTRPAPESRERPHALAWTLALAHRLDELARSGAVRDQSELARLGHVTRTRICQFMTLLHLAPAIQEHLLFLTVAEQTPLTEPLLRKIAREPRWDRQRAKFEALLRRK